MAEFYRGVAFECDVSAPLTIEGNPIQIKRASRGNEFIAKLPSGKVIKEASVRALARRYIRRSGMLDRRKLLTKMHLQVLRKGRAAWNRWRRANPHIWPMLANEDLSATFKNRPLDRYDFSYTNLTQANLRGVHLKGANFHQAILAKADLSGAHLEDANFCRTDLYETNFRNAWFADANLQGVQLVRTDLRGAHLSGCRVYGLSAWDLELEGDEHEQLIIRYRPATGRSEGEQEVRVEGLDLAAFMYLTLNNRNISRIIEAATRQWVLILGRFSQKKTVLDEMAAALKKRQFIPIIFDFARPQKRDLIETVMLLAGMSAFVIVEITDARSVPMELQAIASNYGVPIAPIIERGKRPFGMFAGFAKYPWVLPLLEYGTTKGLIAGLEKSVIRQATAEAQRLIARKGKWRPTRNIQ